MAGGARGGTTALNEVFKAVGLQQAMQVIPALSIALAIVLWAGSRTLIADMRETRSGRRSRPRFYCVTENSP